MGDLLIPSHFAVLLAVVVALLLPAIIRAVPFWVLCKRSGRPPLLALLNLIPFGGTVLAYVLAFAPGKAAPEQQAALQ